MECSPLKISTIHPIDHKITKIYSSTYITKNNMSLFFIAQEMLESQICLWCIFANNLLDKVS